ncbi:MAG TPA: type IV secretory system conjugative DNA transfer family protein [Thermomicrobiales bacterium]|nr:type IV secretory system conjugative DNA transfer family protein [Thermomicrobiales bacterium]
MARADAGRIGLGRWARPAVLLALVASALLAGALAVRPLTARVVRAEHEAELTLAWPVVWGAGSLDAWRTAARETAVTGRAGVPASAPPSFAAWRAEPVAARWTRYTSPTWRPVRLATRLVGGIVIAIAGLLALRVLGRPLLRAAWFAGALAIMFSGRKPGDSHGSARWATPAEVRRRGPRAGRADLVVGRVGRHRVAIPEERLFEHLLLVAPSGAGKTSGLIIPNLLREAGSRSLILLDPKRELLKRTAPRLRRVYGDGRVWALDLLDPAISAGYNPLAGVVDAASADLFAQTWVMNTGISKEPFWDNAARTLIGAAALHLVATEEVLPPLAALLDFLCGQPAEAIKATLASSPVPEARRLARGFLANMEKNERLLGSVFAELPPRFACLNFAAVRRVTAMHELDLARLAYEPAVLYLPLNLDHARTLAPVLACFFRDLFTILTRIATDAPSGRLPVPVLAYLDEFGTIGHIPEFASRMATVRSMGLGCLLVVQSQSQLIETYGRDDADTILGNANTKLCLAGVGKGVTTNDAQYFSELAGTTTVHSRNQGSTRAFLSPWADRGNRGANEVARALITPDELRTMRGQVLVIAGQEHPLLARQCRYYEDPALRALLPDPSTTDPLVPLRRRREAAPLPDPRDGCDDAVGASDTGEALDGHSAGSREAGVTAAKESVLEVAFDY